MTRIKHLHLPSGLQTGIGLLIDKNWTTEQAVAVVELLDDLREVIVRHYQPQIEEFMRQNRSTPFDSNSCVDKYGDGEPF